MRSCGLEAILAMAFYPHERFQAHCRRCFKVLEADSIVEAIAAAEQHERTDCPGKPAPVAQRTVTDAIREEPHA